MYAYILDIEKTYEDGTEIPEYLYIKMQQNAAWWSFSIMVIITVVSFVLAIFIKEDLRRLRFSL
jgi:predicted membrane channel-forming protein YqfA (hemolysin III family)